MVRYVLEHLLHKTKPLRRQGQTLIIAAICLITLASTQCSRSEDRASSRGSTVIVAYERDGERALHPNEGNPPQFLVFLPLVIRDENGELEGRLARSWEHSPDYREWTYHLRTDLRWHDGMPVTAHDVKFTLDLLTHPDVLEWSPSTFESYTVLDDATITIRYRQPRQNLYLDVYTVHYPKHLLEGLDPAEIDRWEFWTHPVGNGPYRFVRYVPQTMMEFEANPDYYRGMPRIERVVLKLVGEAGLTELLSGNVDAVTYINPVNIPKLGGDPRFRVYHSFLEGVARAIYWQNDLALFQDPRVRRALTLAINRRELLQLLNLPEDIPIIDGPYTTRQLQRGELPVPLPYDPGEARTLLAAAGWRDQDGNGVSEREGREFRFTAMVRSVYPFKEIAVYVQDQLRRVGVRMDVQMLDPILVPARLKTGDFEAAFTYLQVGPDNLSQYFGEGNPLGYENAELVEVLERARMTADPEAKDRVYREFTRIFRAEWPATFLSPTVGTVFAHRRIKGLSSPWRADPVWFMEDLWLEDEN